MPVGRARSSRSLRSAVGALAGGGLMLFAACRPADHSPASDAPSTTLRIGVGQMLSSPAQGMAAFAQLPTVESLARIASDGRPQPWLARNWQVSEDRRSLTVNLPAQATF